MLRDFILNLNKNIQENTDNTMNKQAFLSQAQEMKRGNQEKLIFEMIVVIAVSLVGMWLVSSMKTLFALIPPIYLLVERRFRQRSWRELGFTPQSFLADLKANRVPFILLGFVIQPLIVLLAKTGFPEYLAHIQARLPFDSGISWGVLMPMLVFSLMSEEMTYRVLIQGRLAAGFGVPLAVSLSSLLFGLAHFSPGDPLVVLTDISMIVVSSLLYGTMFARRHNIWPVWLAHLLGDIFGLLALASL